MKTDFVDGANWTIQEEMGGGQNACSGENNIVWCSGHRSSVIDLVHF